MPQNQHSTSLPKRGKVNLLLSQIEEQLNWGASKEWSGADFERLSDLIFEKSQKRLSVTTLKRTWGRTSQLVKQSNTTLDILSHYAGVSTWRDFLSGHSETIVATETIDEVKPTKHKAIYVGGGLAVGLMILLMAFGSSTSDQSGKFDIQSTEIKFDIQKVTKGIPNTVIFRYDVGSITPDTLELQQSWDESKRILLNPLDSLVTTTYFTPGYFNAKLVADGEIIKKQDLYLPSDGLEVMVFLQDEEIPRLLPKDHWTIYSNEFQLASTFDQSFGGKEKNSLLIVNLLEEPPVAAEAFEFRTSLRLSMDDEGDPCNPISIIITGSEDVYMFELGHPGCAGKFSSYLGGAFTTGENTDLSAMGFLENEWVDIRVLKKGSKVLFKTNDKEIIVSDSALSIGKIGGVRMYSSQKIALRKLEIQDKNRSIDLLKDTHIVSMD
ncbi:MAG: hypothetical protein ACI9FN_001710 [Saprospiraceae bacterium]|jgi:hypothetical protein